MTKIVVIGGSPGTGKTTFAVRLANEDGRGVHLRADMFFRSIAQRIDPSTSAAHEQNEVVLRAVARAARAFAQAGYGVYVDGVIGPWMLPVIREELRSGFDYVVLRADLPITLRRAASRQDQPSARPPVIEAMHRQFEALTQYERCVIETTGRTIDAVLTEFRERRPHGDFRVEKIAP